MSVVTPNETYDSIPVPNVSTSFNYVLRKNQYTEMEFGALDYLVMTAVLLFSLGLSVSKTMSQRRDVDDISEMKQSSSLATDLQNSSGLIEIFASAASTTSPFVNTLCLFGLTGEIFKHDVGVVFFLIGLFLSIPMLVALHFFSITSNNEITSFPAYLKKRYQRKGISSIVAFSSILRHFMGGALNLCAVGIGIAAMTDLPAFIVSVMIVALAVFCTSMSRIHSGNNESIGGILIWIVGVTCLTTLIVTTTKEGGFHKLFSEAKSVGKLQLPNVSLAPWAKNSLWGFLTIGVIMGFQLFAFSRITLRHANDMPIKAFFGTLFATYILIFLWTFIGFWAGICVSVAFRGTKVDLPDGLMAQLVSKEMEQIGGFRGFFVSALLAASVSGQTRRYNQLIELIWETGLELFGSQQQREISVSENVKTFSKHVPEDYLKELTFERRRKTCCFHFSFKFFVGLIIGALSLVIVFMFHTTNITVWELWLSVIGIFIGPLVAAMLIGLLFPCISHMSVCLGLLIGWAIPCFLIISNYSSETQMTQYSGNDLPYNTEFSTPVPTRFLHLKGLNITVEETVYIIYNGEYVPRVLPPRIEEADGETDEMTQFERSFRSKILSTNYCYYGPIGTISCIISSLLFAGVAGKFRLQISPLSAELLHPVVKKKWFIAAPGPPDETEATMSVRPETNADPKNRKKINALKFIQESANI